MLAQVPKIVHLNANIDAQSTAHLLEKAADTMIYRLAVSSILELR